LYRFPVNRDIARFVGEAVLVAGSVKNDRVECCFGHLPLAPEAHCGSAGAVDILIRPEQFRLYDPQSSDDANDGATQTARVEQLRFYGHDAQVTLQLHQGLRFTATVPGFDLPAEGQSIRFRITGNVIAYPRQPE
jgi:iron(III) transport system ATP-binding protein